MTAHSIPARVVEQAATVAPPSFDGDLTLYGWNLFCQTAFFFVALMLTGHQTKLIWLYRREHQLKHPVSLHRLILLLAALAATLRCGAEALFLWGWNPHDPVMTARVLMAKRWLDPVAICCGFAWMSLAIMAQPGIEFQLTKKPLPVDLWSRWPVLQRGAGVVALAMVAASAAVLFR